MYEVVHQLLRSCVQPTQRMISNLVQIELAYINTAHPDFIGGKLALGKVPKKEQTSSSVGIFNRIFDVFVVIYIALFSFIRLL